MSFASEVTSTNSQDIDILFGEKTPGADNLVGGKKDEKTTPVTTPKTETSPADIDTPPALINHEEDADLLLGGDATPVGETKAKSPVTKKVESKIADTQEVNFEAIYNDMVAQGLWKELAEEPTEWNKDTFLQVQKLQSTSQYEDLLSRTGKYGKAIIEYEQDGGNPAELLSLFRDQKDVQEFDITDIDSQVTFLRAYLENQGNSQKSIERTIKALQDQGPEALKEEAEEKKTIWDEQYNQEIEARKKEQTLYSKQLEEAQKNFETTILTTLTADSDATPKERKDLQTYMLNYSQSFQGKKVSQFYTDMAEIQKDPKSYVELAKFIKGLKTGEYTKKVADKVKKEVSATSYLKIKNNSTVRGTTGGSPDVDDNTSKGSNFLSLLNKK